MMPSEEDMKLRSTHPMKQQEYSESKRDTNNFYLILNPNPKTNGPEINRARKRISCIVK